MLKKAAWQPSPAAGEARTASSKDQYIDPVGVLRVLRRRWAVIASILALAVAVAGIYVATTSQRYTASSLLLFNVRDAEQFQQRGYPNPTADSAYIDSQVEVLRSEAIARSVVRNLNLLSDPEFISRTGGLVGIFGKISSAIFGSGTKPNQEGRAVAAFQRNLTIKRIGSTYVIQIDYRSLDATKAARISNAVTEAYLSDQNASKYRFSYDIDAWLRDRLDKLKAQAQNSERAVAEYKAKSNVVGADAPLLSGQQLADLSSGRRVLLKDLESSAQSHRMLYETFLQRVTEFTNQQSFPTNEARIVSEASPLLVKNDPKPVLVLGAATILGLIGGLAVAFGREYLDKSFRSSEQVEKELGTECLGVLPTIGPARDRLPNRRRDGESGDRSMPTFARKHRFVVREPFSQFAETVRSSKIAADVAGLHRPNKVIGITSVRPKEGKTLFAANLSEMMALCGCKVLLIDCQLRNAGMTAQFAPAAKAGVIEVITGQAAVKDVIWRDSSTNLSFLPAVKAVANRDPTAGRVLGPAAMCQLTQLTSAGLETLLQSVQDFYDYVILDLASLTPMADVKAISHLIDSFILVIELGGTSQEAAIDALDSAPPIFEKLLGVVLNQHRQSRLKRLAR
ncbi:AAA family ATPase [Bradyrhizobium archetypum]|uniref:non-specific protein-tyrosine kinase n=1 Tax=Bradyrhizobium archetypum TaxID=2721160 RepID=A0A7Y4H4M8_9BRAD|nr:AAA family ATPase [Bradyrhizobium archetypum]NOJ47560.1 AAA family ATPase [Bradyrhizobium archetypum]